MFCTSCGKELKQGAKFCTYCGTHVPGNGTKSKHNNLSNDDLDVSKKHKTTNESVYAKQNQTKQSEKNRNQFNDLKSENVNTENGSKKIYIAIASVAIIGLITICGMFFINNNSSLFGNKKNAQTQSGNEDKKLSGKDNSNKQSNDVNLGITSGNLINCCFVLQDKGTIYYSNFSQGFKLYKMTSDGLNVSQINGEDSGYFTQNGDYIYYSNDTDNGKMYSIKKDGSAKTKVCDDKVSYLQFADGFIYYKNESDGGKVYKISSDGNSRQSVSDSCDIYNISSGHLYYLKDGKLKKKNLKDGEEKLIGYSVSKMIVDNNKIYYTDNGENGLYKMDSSGNNKTQICSDNVPIFNVVGNEIFYRNKSDDNKLYKITVGGSDKKKISDTPVVLIISAGDYIYCNAMDKTMFKVKKDGTDQQSILR